MENRCQRCNRELSDPNAVFGWRCAEILGVSGELSRMGADIFRKFVAGVMKAKKLFGNSNYKFTDEQWKKLYSAFAKMSLWDGVDERKVKEARKERTGSSSGAVPTRAVLPNATIFEWIRSISLTSSKNSLS